MWQIQSVQILKISSIIWEFICICLSWLLLYILVKRWTRLRQSIWNLREESRNSRAIIGLVDRFLLDNCQLRREWVTRSGATARLSFYVAVVISTVHFRTFSVSEDQHLGCLDTFIQYFRVTFCEECSYFIFILLKYPSDWIAKHQFYGNRQGRVCSSKLVKVSFLPKRLISKERLVMPQSNVPLTSAPQKYWSLLIGPDPL